MNGPHRESPGRTRSFRNRGASELGVRPGKVGGSIYPGLVDLHNHLSYDELPMWQVPDRYENRDQWARHPDYRRLISGPMNVLGKTRGYPEAIAHYAEC